MKRKDISAILISEMSEDEKVSAILNLYHTDVDELRDTLDERQHEIDRLTADVTAAKNAKTEAENALEEFKNTTEQQRVRGEKTAAVKELLKEAGIAENRIDSVLRVVNLDDYNVENGVVADKESKLNEIKSAWADFIPTVKGAGAPTEKPANTNPPASYSRADISKMSADEINKHWDAVKAALKNGD